jgi:hypothetical protein
MSSVVWAGEKVLHSMAMPAMPMRGRVSEEAGRQPGKTRTTDKSSPWKTDKAGVCFFMAFDFQQGKSTKEWRKTCIFAP